MTARSILQIVDKPGRIEGGSILLTRADGSTIDLARLDPRGREIRSVRGKEIAMIFQEPMSSLSPVHTHRHPDRRDPAHPFRNAEA